MKSCGKKGCLSKSCDIPKDAISSEIQPIVFEDGYYIVRIPEVVFQSDKNWAQRQGFNVLGDLWENYNLYHLKKEKK